MLDLNPDQNVLRLGAQMRRVPEPSARSIAMFCRVVRIMNEDEDPDIGGSFGEVWRWLVDRSKG